MSLSDYPSCRPLWSPSSTASHDWLVIAVQNGEIHIFRGTRILVAGVLEQVASGMAWEAIIDEWRGVLDNSIPIVYNNCIL